MIDIIRTNSDNKHFIGLVKLLDADLAQKDGADHLFYAQFNKIDTIGHVLVAFDNGIPVGCGAIKKYTATTMEVKRMYTAAEQRGRGIASSILAALEEWVTELGYESCILETGKRQVEATALYKKNGYNIIPNYGQYAGVDNSICFEKKLG